MKKSQNTVVLILVKIMPYILMSVIVWLLYGLFAWWFKMPFFYNIVALSALALLFVLSVSFIGIAVSIILPNQLKATEVLMVIATPAFMISGFTWPLSQMPKLIQYAAQVIPTTHFLPIFRTLVIEHGTVDMIGSSVLGLVIITIVGAVGSYVALEFQKRKFIRASGE